MTIIQQKARLHAHLNANSALQPLSSGSNGSEANQAAEQYKPA
jgi:hypothetical protein